MKPQLAELIEAYAASRLSGNKTLMEFAVSQLNGFLSKIDVVPIETKTEDKPEE